MHVYTVQLFVEVYFETLIAGLQEEKNKVLFFLLIPHVLHYKFSLSNVISFVPYLSFLPYENSTPIFLFIHLSHFWCCLLFVQYCKFMCTSGTQHLYLVPCSQQDIVWWGWTHLLCLGLTSHLYLTIHQLLVFAIIGQIGNVQRPWIPCNEWSTVRLMGVPHSRLIYIKTQTCSQHQGESNSLADKWV